MSQEFLTAILATTTANMKMNVIFGVLLNEQELQVLVLCPAQKWLHVWLGNLHIPYTVCVVCDRETLWGLLYVTEKHFED